MSKVDFYDAFCYLGIAQPELDGFIRFHIYVHSCSFLFFPVMPNHKCEYRAFLGQRNIEWLFLCPVLPLWIRIDEKLANVSTEANVVFQWLYRLQSTLYSTQFKSISKVYPSGYAYIHIQTHTEFSNSGYSGNGRLLHRKNTRAYLMCALFS